MKKRNIIIAEHDLDNYSYCSIICDLAKTLEDRYGITLRDPNDNHWYRLEEIKEKLLSEGPSAFLNIRPVTEAVMKKCNTSEDKDVLIAMLTNMVSSLKPERMIIFSDPFIFLPKGSNDHSDSIVCILQSILNKVNKITFITQPNYDKLFFKYISDKLLLINNAIIIECKTTSIVHDRFIIADEERGLMIGCSINGIGNKLAFAYTLPGMDVLEVVDILKENSLL